jgi:hypothetical protein
MWVWEVVAEGREWGGLFCALGKFNCGRAAEKHAKANKQQQWRAVIRGEGEHGARGNDAAISSSRLYSVEHSTFLLNQGLVYTGYDQVANSVLRRDDSTVPSNFDVLKPLWQAPRALQVLSKRNCMWH